MAAQITLRGVSAELARRLKRISAERGESVNTTVIKVLSEVTGIHGRRERLERYVTWSDEDRAELEASLLLQRTVDEKLWR